MNLASTPDAVEGPMSCNSVCHASGVASHARNLKLNALRADGPQFICNLEGLLLTVKHGSGK